MKLISIPSGEIALIVGGQVIIEGDTKDDSAYLVRQVGRRLSSALEIPLTTIEAKPDSEDWNWVDLKDRYATSVTLPTATCRKCGSRLHHGFCVDMTCPFSAWPQQVSVSEMVSLSADEIVASHGLVRAEAHSDDHVLECHFFAESWFIGASDEEIIQLSDEGWGMCEEADGLARQLGGLPDMARLFDYLQLRNAGIADPVGFECSVNEQDALNWLHRNRYGLWCRLHCDSIDVRIVEAVEPDGKGKFVWLDGQGKVCDSNFLTADQAAMDAVEKLSLDGHPVSPIYAAFWDAGTFAIPSGRDIISIVGQAMFCADRGYDPEEIESIHALSVGETWEATHYGPSHTVMRIR